MCIYRCVHIDIYIYIYIHIIYIKCILVASNDHARWNESTFECLMCRYSVLVEICIAISRNCELFGNTYLGTPFYLVLQMVPHIFKV